MQIFMAPYYALQDDTNEFVLLLNILCVLYYVNSIVKSMMAKLNYIYL